MLPKSSSRPLPAILAQSRNLAHASLKTAVIEDLDSIYRIGVPEDPPYLYVEVVSDLL